MASKILKVGQVVRYPDPPVLEPEELNGYRNFFNLTAVPGARRLTMNRGISHPAWTSAPDGERRAAILIRSNPLQAGTAKTPWHDVLDLEKGRLQYYGDHRSDSPGEPARTRGNAELLAAAKAHGASDAHVRATATPLLIFKSVERNNSPKGYLEFCGLGVVARFEEVRQRDPQTNAEFPNFLFHIQLLDLSSDGGQLDWQWIDARRDPTLTSEQANRFAPTAWRTWLNIGRYTDPAPKEASPTDNPQRQQTSAIRPPDWVWDELVLVCAAVYKNDWREIKQYDARAIELSELLQIMPIHPPEMRGANFRSANSVQRKTADIATAHPSYPKKQTKGGKLTRDVVNAFIRDPARMLAAAEGIAAALASTDPSLKHRIATPDPDEMEETAMEGRLLERIHRFRERNPSLRQRKIAMVVRNGGALRCEVCGFDFSERFGKHGEGYIEVHHTTPLHETGITETRLDDLALLCANCHRMSHRRLEGTGTWPSPEELRKLLEE
ncbi:HNH endonuclease [Actinomadura sp. SCN-SB]|uniref:HNH endonuclease n=1 Tax=Actinomadura sp. SCN-SB TaxID=3373092 RepID=UPI00375331FC